MKDAETLTGEGLTHLAVEYLPIAGLTPYANNARTHGPEQVAQLADSIRAFGWTNPVLIDEAGGIIAGHGRVMAAEQLGMEEVPCIRLPHLSETQRRAYALADNRLALNAGWDDALLAQELVGLPDAEYDVASLGFDDGELARLLGAEAGSAMEPDAGIDYVEKFAVLVECKDEADQQRIFEELTSAGMTCKVLVN